MSSTADTANDPRCWIQIGVFGDSTCPELPRVGHCHNCQVYAAGGRQLLDRPAPADYLDSWTELLAREKDAEATNTVPHLIFLIGESWLGFRAVILREITHAGVIRRVPHRPPDLLLGLTTVRGEIYPCISLHALFGEPQADAAQRRQFLVARSGGHDWVFPADEILGIYDIAESAIEPLPVTLTHNTTVFTSGMVECERRQVGLIDDTLVFSALERRIA